MGKNVEPEMVSLSISAWSLKARFALKHHGVRYRTTPYLPLLGELALRLRLGEWRSRLSVPVMFTPHDGVLRESYDIARWADAHSAREGAQRLFPAGREAEITSWNAKSDIILHYGRKALVEGLLADPAALRRQVPPSLRWLGPLGAALLRLIVRRLRGKYAAESGGASLEQTVALLRELQAALRSNGGGGGAAGAHLVGGALSYADMAMAVAVQVIKPLGPPFAASPWPGMRELQPYAEEFADLVAWRDRLFEAHFPLDANRRKAKAS